MQNKEFTSREKGMIKNTAKAVYPLYEKLLKLEAQSQKLQLEIETQRNLINKWEAGVMDLTGGYKSTELVKKEMITVGEGEKAIRKANYTFTMVILSFLLRILLLRILLQNLSIRNLLTLK